MTDPIKPTPAVPAAGAPPGTPGAPPVPPKPADPKPKPSGPRTRDVVLDELAEAKAKLAELHKTGDPADLHAQHYVVADLEDELTNPPVKTHHA